MNSSSFISLTETGKSIALKVYDRHQILTDLFVSLGVDEATAADDACRVEHVISDQTFEALKKINKK
jgi:Mn-dependent transcriptional regulator